jgi:hypothetical protein
VLVWNFGDLCSCGIREEKCWWWWWGLGKKNKSKKGVVEVGEGRTSGSSPFLLVGELLTHTEYLYSTSSCLLLTTVLLPDLLHVLDQDLR